MWIYFSLMLIWMLISELLTLLTTSKKAKIIYSIFVGLTLIITMGFRHYSVGTDIVQYLSNFFALPTDISLDLFKYDEWGFRLLLIPLKNIGMGVQQYIFIMSSLMVLSFTVFFYRNSNNVFLSFYLHLTIGLFSMSMSGIRQTLAICIILFAYEKIKKRKLTWFIFLIFIAGSIHNSAIVFLPIYWLRNIKITRKKGVILLFLTTTFLYLRTSLVPLIGFLAPNRYLERYELLTDSYRINPILVIIAFLIPLACLIFWKEIEQLGEIERKNFSLLFILACLNLFFNILSLNSNMLGRLSFYFMPFINVLIPNVISNIRNKKLKIIALYVAIVFPLIQFSMSTPGGTYQIDQYKFFWQ